MRRQLLWLSGTGLGVLLVMFTVFMVVGPEKTSAGHRPCNSWYGRNCWNGYFYDREQIYNGTDVIIGGMPGIGTGQKQAFIDKVTGYLNSGNSQNVTAAQFIILSMIGRAGGLPKSVSAAQMTEWRARVNNPNVSMVVRSVLFQCDISNSYYQTDHNDIAAGYSTAPECGRNDLMIDFIYNNAVVYRIRVACANPLGNLPGLPTAVQPTVVNCDGMNVDPPNPTAGQDFRITARVKYSGGPPTPTWSNTNITVSPNPGSVPHDPTRSGDTITLTSRYITVTNGGNFNVSWTVKVNETTRTCNGSFSAYPPTEVACANMYTVPNDPELGQPVTIYARLLYTGGPPSASVTNESMVLNGPGTNNRNLAVVDKTSGGGVVVLRSEAISLSNAGRYTVTWNALVNNVAPDNAPCGGTYSANDSFDVMAYPYLQVTGGDVAAGVSFETDTPDVCGAHNEDAGIASWNNRSPGFAGAGGQYGVSAWSYIQDFISNQNPGRVPTSLSFSNVNDTSVSPDTVNQAEGRFGGFFKDAPCVDYWGKRPTAPRPVPSPSLNGLDGIYMHTGPLTINPSSIGNGTKLTIYVKGNVNIRGNITYSGSSWSSIKDIPNFKLIVNGVIHINARSPGVTELDGTYIAVPDNNYVTEVNSYTSPDNGTISTCSNGFNVIRPTQSPVSGMINDCNRPLKVNGSFAANHIFFLRTNGTKSSGQPAETFNFTPETWLAPSNNSRLDSTYQSIISLPPVL